MTRDHEKAQRGSGRPGRAPPPRANGRGNAAQLQAAFPIVGVGASAGGLEAFSELLHQIARASDSGMAFVLIQHLDPDARELPARGAGQDHHDAGQPGRGRHARGAQPRLRHPAEARPSAFAAAGSRWRRARTTPRSAPADRLLLSRLAAERGSRAIGVVLSGTASDGTEGLQAIKEANGITFAQEPRSAKFSGHAAQRGRCGRRRLLPPDPRARPGARAPQPPSLRHRAPSPAPPIQRRRRAGARSSRSFATAVRVDFGEYKSPTLRAASGPRMALRRVDTIDGYLALLEQAPDEVLGPLRGHPHPRHLVLSRSGGLRAAEDERLPRHREGQARGRAHSGVGGRLLDRRRGLLARDRAAEFLGESSQPVPDLRIRRERARPSRRRAPASTPSSALRDVSEERRRRYFTKVDRGYRINKSSPGSVRLRPARPRARPAVLEARSGELPQRPHLLRPGRSRSASSRPFTTR